MRLSLMYESRVMFFHSYQLLPGAVFHRYRLESIVLSALLIRKWMSKKDRLALVTDNATLALFCSLGLTSLYDELVVPDEIEGVDQKHFFALIKLRGLSHLNAPIYSVDWDLFILTQELFNRIRDSKACGLHHECTCGEAYKSPEQYSHCLSTGDFESLPPINAGVLGFASEANKRRYCDVVFDFMRRFSAFPLPNQSPLFVMMFAEQQILGYLKQELDIEILFEWGATGYFYDQSCFHTWGMKFLLDSHKIERDKHRNWCRDVMSQCGIEIPKFLDSIRAEKLP